MAEAQLGSRFARFQALKLATGVFPRLKARMPFCGEVRHVIDEGETVEQFSEEQDVVLSPAEVELATRLPNPPPAHVSRHMALVRLANVTVLGNTGKPIDETRGLLLRSRLEPLAVEVNDFRAERSRPIEQPPANYVYFMGEHSGHAHFFHFLFDRLPRLYYLLERFETGREPLIVLVNENPPGFQRDIFRFLEARYANLRFREIPRAERWRLPQLLFIDDDNTTTRATFLARETLEFMRGLIIGGYGLSPAPAHHRLYVNRGDARKRRLKNEAELWPLFAAKGFQSVAAAKFSFRDQVALFSEASAIAGPHGAGLSHILFAPPGVQTLEIFPADKAFDIDYLYLTKAMGGSYDAVIGTRGDRIGAFRIDAALVEAALQRF
jgi:hypothetical protein